MYDILTGEENQTLRTKAEEVTVFDAKLQQIVQEMTDTMLAPDTDTEVRGVGLAAPQVGILKRIIILTFNLESPKHRKIIAMINPEITEFSKHQVVMDEGCLSLPGQFDKVRRPAKVKVRWKTPEGQSCEKKLDGWDARIFLHEFDHLEGKLFTDYLK